jgi:hypothetical protein
MRIRETRTVSEEKWRDWFERSWEIREEEVYPNLFGHHAPDVSVLTADLFVNRFKQESFDPRWLHSGVFEVPPTLSRSSWLYASSGLSNPWHDDEPNPSGVSGLGMEFVLQTPLRAEWALERLAHVVAFQTLIAYGRYPGRDLLYLHDRIPLRSSIGPEPSDLTWLVIGPPDGLPTEFRLPTGSVELLAVVGVTEVEAAYGRSRGGEALIGVLRKGSAYPVTDPRRSSVVGPNNMDRFLPTVGSSWT